MGDISASIRCIACSSAGRRGTCTPAGSNHSTGVAHAKGLPRNLLALTGFSFARSSKGFLTPKVQLLGAKCHDALAGDPLPSPKTYSTALIS